ncbi:zinc finger protein 60-like [Saccostrea echinata]|uniref:zinc finger protein 60-like n=1 Tax=Saccostrea echinata TaxID=191078 RepID=UPI002A83B061|nr:zinc finger protein 60-like [Saccostrea echinata]
MEKNSENTLKDGLPELMMSMKNPEDGYPLVNSSRMPEEAQDQGQFQSNFPTDQEFEDMLNFLPSRSLRNGLKNEFLKKAHVNVDQSAAEGMENNSSLTTLYDNNRSNFRLSNGCNFESDMPSEKRENSKIRNRRKPQHSMSKTELYDDSFKDDLEKMLNEEVAELEKDKMNHSNNSEEEDTSVHVGRYMQRIKPDYFQVSQSTNIVNEIMNTDHTDEESIQKSGYQCKYCHLLLYDLELFMNHVMTHQTEYENLDDGRSSNQVDETLHHIKVNQTDFDSVHIGDISERNSNLLPNPKQEDSENMARVEETKLSEMKEFNIGSFVKNLILSEHTKGKRGRKRKDQSSSEGLYGSPVKCPVCFKAFKTKNNLKTHMCKFHSDRKDKIQEFFGQGEKMKEKAVCCLCGKCFISKYALMRHMDTRHANEAYVKCSVCDEVFENDKLLSEHANIHNQDRNERRELTYSSPEPNDSSETKRNPENYFQNKPNEYHMDQSCIISSPEIQNHVTPLNNHAQENQQQEENHSLGTNHDHSDQIESARKCENSEEEKPTSHYFQSDSDRANEDNLKPTGINCNVCWLPFDSLGKFALHCMASSECLNCKQCPVCQKVINSSLKEHLKSHSDDRPYQCEICQASFKRNHQMKLHKQTVHSDLRLYHCELCDKSFKRRDKLTCHYRTHSDEHPFMCTECGSVFKWKHHLKRHKDNVHADKATQLKARKFPCDICGNCFKWRHHLKRHLRNVHHMTDDSWDPDDSKTSLDLSRGENESMDLTNTVNNFNMESDDENIDES